MREFLCKYSGGRGDKSKIIVTFDKTHDYDDRATPFNSIFARGGAGAYAGQFPAQA